MKQNILLLFCCFIFYNVCNAQQVFSTAGKSANNSNLKLDYTIGEPIILTKSNGTTTLTQGFHQPTYQFVTKVSQSLKDVVDIKLFPNPSNGSLTIKDIQFDGIAKVVTITDLSGRLVQEFTMTQSVQQLDLSNIADGMYHINIKDSKSITNYPLVVKK